MVWPQGLKKLGMTDRGVATGVTTFHMASGRLTKSQPTYFCAHCTTFKSNILDVYARSYKKLTYKKLWGLYRINLDDDWYLQAVARTIFGCSGTHFWTKFGTN